MNALSNFNSAGVAGVYNFNITSAPPYTTLQVFVNGIDYTPLVAPTSTGLVQDSLVTDRYGAASGKITILKSYGDLSATGDLDVTFVDDITKQLVSKYTISGAGASSDKQVDSTRSSIAVSTKSSADVTDAAAIGNIVDVFTPYTQTFFVDGTKYPNGLFISSIELFFARKDTLSPVSIQLRKVVSGVPSSTEIIPGSICVLEPAAVVVPADPEKPGSLVGQFTKFPIISKLLPGEYGISVLTDSKNYSLYTAVFGQTSADNKTIAQKEPNIGKLFKSQNTNTWLEETNKSLCFGLNKAVFNTGTSYFELKTEAIPETYYDSILLNVVETGKGFNSSDITYTLKSVNTGNAPGTLGAAENIDGNSATTLPRRKVAVAAGDMVVGVTMTNSSRDVSPVFDKSRASIYTFANEIDPYDADTRAAELTPSGGIAHSRYVSKIVTLASGFESTGLEVKLDVNRKIGTDIDVFCRVMSPQDINSSNKIENLAWVRMPLYNKDATITAPDSLEGQKSYAGYGETFTTETYKILETDSVATTGVANLSYEAIVGEVLTTFDTFNKFQIKVVMYSLDTTIVPKIKNLIATAVL